MKRILIGAALIVLLGGVARTAFAQDNLLAKQQTGGAPKAETKVESFDFGSVKQGATVTQTFSVFNKGDAPLKILDVQADCGCTVAEPESRLIDPGSSANINVIFDTTGFRGYKVKTVRIYTNDPRDNALVFSLKGNIQRDVELEPARVYFGPVRRGEPKTIQVKFQKYSTEETEITDILGRSESVEIQRTDTGFDVRLKDSVPFGVFRDRIVVKTTSKETPIIHLPVFARVNGDIVAKPSDVSFGLIEGPLVKEVSREVELSFAGSGALEVLDVKSDTRGLVAEMVEGAGATRIRVTLKPGVRGVFHSKVTVRTNHPDEDQKVVEIPVYGIVSKKGS